MNSLDRFYNYFIDEGWRLSDMGWVAPDNWDEDLPTPEEFDRVRAQVDITN